MIAELEIGQLTRASDQFINEIESDAAAARCGGREFLEFVGERLYVGSNQTNKLTQHLIVSRYFQFLQVRLGPRLCFRIFQRRELDDSANIKQHLAGLLAFVELVG